MLCDDKMHPFYKNELTDEKKLQALTSKKLEFPPKYFSKRGFPKQVEEIISGLLQVDTTKRWRVSRVITHPYMKKTYENLIQKMREVNHGDCNIVEDQMNEILKV